MTRPFVPILVALTLVAPSSAAETSPPESSAQPVVSTGPRLRVEAEHRWYGWQTLLVDTASFTTIFATALDDGPGGVVPALGVAGYVLGGPVVHMAHGRWLHAGISGALRLGLPLALAGTVLVTSGDCRDSLGDTYGCLGAGIAALGVGAIGAIVASVIDIAALTHESIPTSRPVTSLDVRSTPTRGGFVVGLTRTF